MIGNPRNAMRRSSRILCVILVIALIGSAATAGVVTAQSSPGEPLSAYGDISDEDGTPAPSGTEVFAVVNGEVEDSIEVTEAGQYGSEAAFEDRLNINTGAGDEVVFTVNDPNGTESINSPYEFNGDAGKQEVALTFPSGTFEASSGDDGTDDSDADNGDDTSGSDDGGAGGSGGGAGGSTSDGDSQTESGDSSPDVQAIRDRLQVAEPSVETTTTIEDTAPDAAGITVQPQDTDSVREITFENEEATGSVEITEYNNLPQSLRDEITASTTAAGATDSVDVVSVSEISPDTETAEDSAARVSFSVSAQAVTNPQQLTVIKDGWDFAQQADTWEEVETTVEDRGEEEIIVSADIDQFSTFVLAEGQATTESTAGDDTESNTTTDDSETGDGAPGFGVIPAIVALVAGALALYKN